MQKNPIGWFEIPVTDMDRAEKFYGGLFGVTFDRQPEKGGFLMSWWPAGDMEGYGATGTLAKGENYTPSHDGTLVYFTAPNGSVEDGVKKAEALGAKILFPKTSIGEHGYIAWIEDSEGNRIAIHSMDG